MTDTDLNHIAEETLHWLQTAVIGLNLCPFAKAVFNKGLIRIEVSHARHLDDFLEHLDRELLLLRDTPADEIETTLLVEPQLFANFELFNDVLDITDQVLVEHGLEGVIQIAPFHPQFQFADSEPNAISNYTNRSPYPTLHLIREDSIAKAMQAFPDADTIFERNIALLEQMGIEGWQALWKQDKAS
ncbi:MAG TPA: DUF1415 domain-containing protein [Vitreoscilla sp.]|nr:DUF1415 domain-containing protein [Vitreoscilla sp.]